MEVLVEVATGRQVVGAGLGLAEEPPGVAQGLWLIGISFASPVAEAAGFDDGDEVGAEFGFAGAGEGVAGEEGKYLEIFVLCQFLGW